MLSAYWPGSSLLAGKLKRPLSSVATLTVTVEPAFLALTTTPSIRPSLADDTVPASARGGWLWACDALLQQNERERARDQRKALCEHGLSSFELRRDGFGCQSSGSSLTIEAPWLEPTQNVTGVVELSTNTRRMLVERGSRYWTHLAGLGVQPRDLVGEHRAGPGLVVLVEL